MKKYKKIYVYNINELEKKNKINIFYIINILSIRIQQINDELNKSLLKRKFKKKKKYIIIKKFELYPNSVYLSIYELLKKKIIVKKCLKKK
ncbi:MAG: hypothetical protein NHG13_00180 [Candidatus Shikimatogenerans bostrichidophilus]|nr:MAG: hypothetical protein NHG13_00180 [Candidatus Shikimatogenerans bostrichidophilus]